MKVLVTTYRTAGDRIALAAVRGLGRSGAEAWLGGDDASAPSFASRYCSGKLDLPNPIGDPGRHADCVRALVEDRGFATVLPADDYAVYALARSKDESEWPVSLPVPELASYMRSQDKFSAWRTALNIGLAAPKTMLADSVEMLREALAALTPPYVVKLNRGNGSVGLLISDDVARIVENFHSYPDVADDVFDFKRVLVQEYIPGETHDVGLLFNQGEPRAAFTSRRILTYPSVAGGGIYNETTDRPDLREQAIAMLRELRWHGPAAVEFRVDSRDGSVKFIEVNGRLWGTLALSTNVGIDFPTLACRMAVEGDVEPCFSHPAGHRYRWPLPNGFRHAARSGRPLQSLWMLFGPSAGVRSDVWLSDPGPSLRHLRATFRSKQTSLSPLEVPQE
jgi:predicted ATP-grasp superfamily ATP-dependent carboligase